MSKILCKHLIFRVDQDVRFIVFCKGIEEGSEEEWNLLWSKYKQSNVASERQSILSALACTQKVWLLARYQPAKNAILLTINYL